MLLSVILLNKRAKYANWNNFRKKLSIAAKLKVIHSFHLVGCWYKIQRNIGFKFRCVIGIENARFVEYLNKLFVENIPRN